MGRGLLVVKGIRAALTFCDAREPKFDDWVYADGFYGLKDGVLDPKSVNSTESAKPTAVSVHKS